MEAIEVKTSKLGNNPNRQPNPKYQQNIQDATTFLRHSEDRIEVKNGESVNIDIYENGSLIFSGDKWELFKKLKD